MTTTTTHQDVLEFITRRVLPDLERIVNTEGSEDVGSFAPVGRYGQQRAYGEASSLAGFLEDVIQVLDEYTQGEGEDDLSGWHLAPLQPHQVEVYLSDPA